MKRRRITEIFPFLLPLRRAQRRFCFYIKMFFDKNHYVKTKNEEPLPFSIYESKSTLLNEKTGFDMKYQENKVFNLHLAAETVNKILIRPEETFSFWQLVRYAEKYEKYKDGLCVINDNLVTVPGGGLCQLSNMLFWLFLHTPLTIIERHPHKIMTFPYPDPDEPEGIDATVSEGWLDLKVKNETNITFQILISFDDSYIYGRILTDMDTDYKYEITNRDKIFYKEHDKIYEQVSIYQQKIDKNTNEIIAESKLYTNLCEIGYSLPKDIEIINKGE
ncbi:MULTISPECIES: glycopeptide resistance accessory protein VanW [Tissierellales]|uniref:Glycopeptide resistance accessory protein VanW n=1 Tax=Acidilutibacter cellobiosedens TaxID=2507161 RepID=A0A410QBA0_9FIRM|nr:MULTISPECIES: glycopeptide resistance accessory protein VanW [Tissierellales]QAT61239.1 glycopeptide resistance accessory protein VanW [Acidilutibacter cellobiosedens]SCL93425.1 Vancomycin B-type resistance protein VanW [Sporanaerobacter sp. PP17-6a]